MGVFPKDDEIEPDSREGGEKGRRPLICPPAGTLSALPCRQAPGLRPTAVFRSNLGFLPKRDPLPGLRAATCVLDQFPKRLPH